MKKEAQFYLLAKVLLVFITVFFLVSCNKKDEKTDTDIPTQDVYTNGSVTKYWDSGDPANRINMIFIGDGFSSDDQMKWRSHVDDMLSNLFSTSLAEPFMRYKNFFNVYRIDMISKHSGLDADNRYTPLRGMTTCTDYTVGDCITDWTRTHDAIDYYMATVGSPKLKFREVALNTSSPL